jgi:hypothetical protein
MEEVVERPHRPVGPLLLVRDEADQKATLISTGRIARRIATVTVTTTLR